MNEQMLILPRLALNSGQFFGSTQTPAAFVSVEMHGSFVPRSNCDVMIANKLQNKIIFSIISQNFFVRELLAN